MSAEAGQARMDRLPDIEEVSPLSERDEACFREIKEILRQHDSLRRFGLCLLHEHFQTSDDEILVEVCDPETRTLISRLEARRTSRSRDDSDKLEVGQ